MSAPEPQAAWPQTFCTPAPEVLGLEVKDRKDRKQETDGMGDLLPRENPVLPELDFQSNAWETGRNRVLQHSHQRYKDPRSLAQPPLLQLGKLSPQATRPLQGGTAGSLQRGVPRAGDLWPLPWSLFLFNCASPVGAHTKARV